MNRRILRIAQILYLASFCLVTIIGTIYVSLELSNLFNDELILLPESSFYFILFIFIVSLLFHFVSLIYLFKSKIKRAIFLGISGDIATLVFISFLSEYPLDYYIGSLLYQTSISFLIIILLINFSLLILKSGENLIIERNEVKNKILDLSSKFKKVTIKDLSYRCNVDVQNIIKIIEELIQNKEIGFHYDTNNLVLDFEVKVETEYIDQLISKYENWEQEKEEKKSA